MIGFYQCPHPGGAEEELPFSVKGLSLQEKHIPKDQEGVTGKWVESLFLQSKVDWLLCCHTPNRCELKPPGLTRLLEVAETTGATWVYGDCLDIFSGEGRRRYTCDYQAGSVRDDFDFGPFSLINVAAARQVISRTGGLLTTRFGGFYDLRLRMAEVCLPQRIPEVLSSFWPADQRTSGEKNFDYVDPRALEYQQEMEEIVTAYLRRTKLAVRTPGRMLKADEQGQGWKTTASVVIPVRNRENVIEEAVQSALTQEMDLSFNVLVVNNHSTDGTGKILDRLAGADKRVRHIVPSRLDLGIGGCWNEAVCSPECGQWVVQLDSDDLFADRTCLDGIVGKLSSGPYAMVVGSYRLVDFDLVEIPPGVIDHKEWTAGNGPNNLLRVHGIGAPRAYATRVVRRFPFPDVSYGEDYGLALRLSREFMIGRIWEPVYLCRRWGGNTDADLDAVSLAAKNHYKDWLRTQEILCRGRQVADD